MLPPPDDGFYACLECWNGPLTHLGMCAFASRSFSVDRGRPLWQWGLLGLEVSCEATQWLTPSFPPCVPSLSFSFAPSFGRPLCSARRISKCFRRPGTARRWVKECVCGKQGQGERSKATLFWSLCGIIRKKGERFPCWLVMNLKSCSNILLQGNGSTQRRLNFHI